MSSLHSGQLRALIACAGLLSLLGLARAEELTAFAHVNVIPMDRPGVLEDHTVLVRGAEIAAVGPSSELTVPPEARVIDGSGAWLMPGLADMHAHLFVDPDPRMLLLFLAEGVTTIRNLNALPQHLDWRDAVARGELVGPTIYTSGPEIVGPPDMSFVWPFRAIVVGGCLLLGLVPWLGVWAARRLRGDRAGARQLRRLLLPGAAGFAGLGVALLALKVIPLTLWVSSQYPQAVVPDTVARARAAVDAQRAAGVDCVKVYDFLTPEEYLATIDQATKLGLYPVGHALDALTIPEVAASGLRELVHVDEYLDAHLLGEASPRTGAAGIPLDLDRIPQSAKATREHDLMVVSNMVADENAFLYLEAGPSWFDRPEYAVIRPKEKEAWLKGRVVRWQGQQEWRRGTLQPFLMKMTRALYEAGAPLLVGTDWSLEGIVPGHLHRDVELLVEAGLPNDAALRAATANAGQSVQRMGSPDRFGQIVPGQRADLVLLRENPLERVGATRERLGVMARGVWRDQESLDAMVSAYVATF